jgi:hypothetical protein
VFSAVNEKGRLIEGKNDKKLDYFYAKQTQFPGCPDERKYLFTDGL